MRLDLAPAEGQDLRLQASTTLLPGMSVTRGEVSAMSWERTRALLGDANDDVVVSWMAGGFRFDRPGCETVEVARGAACIMPMERSWRAETGDGAWTYCVQFARDALAPLVPSLADLPPDAVRCDTPEGRLLLDYVQALARTPLTPVLRPMVARHVTDLLAAAVGTTPDIRRLVEGRGVRAARLRALKQYVEENLASPRLSAETAARRLSLSPRYVRGLFADENRSFSDYVTDRRLEAVHRRLTDPRFAATPVADIASEAGLVEPSTFYRRFKARYGVRPSDVRPSSGYLRQTATEAEPQVYDEVRL